jgi:ribosomal protein L40E
LPLSINLITDNPLLFILIAFAVVASVTLAVWSVRRPKAKPIRTESVFTSQESSVQESAQSSEGNKFCIFCGANNKKYAVFCEKCGKKTE